MVTASIGGYKMKSSALARFAQSIGMEVVQNSQGDNINREAFVYRFKRFEGSVLYKMHRATGFDACIKYIVINAEISKEQYYHCVATFGIDNCPNFADADWQRDLYIAIHKMVVHNDPSYLKEQGKEFDNVKLLNYINFEPLHAPRRKAGAYLHA